MLRVTSLLLAAGLISATSFGLGQQPGPKIKPVPIQPTSPASGQQMFTTYCAVCHGATGTGNGPAAKGLKTPPADLTVLKQKNGGTFPANKVDSALKFGVANPAHGSPEMPIWGDLMQSLHPDDTDQVRIRIYNLTEFLRQIQK
jgi:mono/diheme cytochrome c family protein